MNAVDACFDVFIRKVDHRTRTHRSELHLSSGALNASKERRLREYEADIAMIDRATEFFWMNVEGFRKIAKKFDKRTGNYYRVSDGVLESLERRNFHLNTAPNRCRGTSTLAQTRMQLEEWAAEARRTSAAAPSRADQHNPKSTACGSRFLSALVPRRFAAAGAGPDGPAHAR